MVNARTPAGVCTIGMFDTVMPATVPVSVCPSARPAAGAPMAAAGAAWAAGCTAKIVTLIRVPATSPPWAAAGALPGTPWAPGRAAREGAAAVGKLAVPGTDAPGAPGAARAAVAADGPWAGLRRVAVSVPPAVRVAGAVPAVPFAAAAPGAAEAPVAADAGTPGKGRRSAAARGRPSMETICNRTWGPRDWTTSTTAASLSSGTVVCTARVPTEVCIRTWPLASRARTMPSSRAPGESWVSGAGGSGTTTAGWGAGGAGGCVGGDGGTTAVTVYVRSLPAMASTSLAASQLGKRVRMEVWLRMASRTLGSRRMTPRSGGENLRKPSQALSSVL